MNEEEYAGFWIRVGAAIIDGIILMIILMPIMYFFFGSTYYHGEIYYDDQLGFTQHTSSVNGFWDFFLNFVLPLLATVWFWKKFQATPGKMATKLRVVDAETGNTLSLGKCVGRYFAYFISFLPLGLGIFWIALDKRKQGWHDKLAGSVVIRSHKKEPVVFKDPTLP
jgi:uncharacterized RDD family membrane protein YckC